MSITGKIVNDSLRRGERTFCVDDPFLSLQLEKRAIKEERIRQVRARRRERDLTGISSNLEEATKDSTKYDLQGFEREEVAVFTRSPGQAVRGESASRDDAVKMDVVLKSLPPGVKDGSETEIAIEMTAREL